MYRILTKEMLTPTICRMKLEAPLLAASARPGQFLMVRADEKGERVPLTISDYDADEGSVTIVTQEIGVSTVDIVAHEAGEFFSDVTGPLGMPSEFTEMPADRLAAQRYIFIAGGVGTAPVYPQAKWLHSRGVPVDVIIGAKTAGLLIYKEEMGTGTQGAPGPHCAGAVRGFALRRAGPAAKALKAGRPAFHPGGLT